MKNINNILHKRSKNKNTRDFSEFKHERKEALFLKDWQITETV